MKKIFEIVGAALMIAGMAAGDSITMEQTSIACMIAPGIMFLTREEKR